MTGKPPRRVLIAGCGDLGGRLGRRLVAAGYRVWGLRRDAARLPAELEPLAGDLARGDLPPLPDVEAVVYTAAADGFSDDAYRRAYVDGVENLLAALPPAPRRWLHVGSTSVYAQSDGEEVDEWSVAEPDQFSGRRLLEGEQRLALASSLGLQSTVVRFGGIYGPGRTRLLDSVRQRSAHCSEPDSFANRIHIEDCVGVLAHLLEIEAAEALYLGVDGEPALDGDVKRWLARRLGLPDPPLGDLALNSRAMRNNKRCSNRRLRASGYEFRYPDFRAGYEALILSEEGSAPPMTER